MLDEHPTNLFLMLNDMFQEMGPDYNRTLYQIFKTYINNIAAILKVNLKPIAYKRASV